MTAPPIELLTGPELAELLQVDPCTVRYWRRHKTGPAFVRIGGTISGKVRYRAEDVRAWLASKVQPQTPPEVGQ